MSALIAVTVLLAAFGGLAYLSAHQHQRQPLLVDAVIPAAMYVCHVRPVRDIPRDERAGKVIQT